MMESQNKEEKIGNIAEFKRGPFGSSIKKSVCVSKGKDTYKLYEQGNIINNDFERGSYYLTKEKFDELSQFEIKEGDLLLTCAGTLGRIAIVPEKFEKGIFNSVLMRIRILEEKVILKYLYYYFQSPKIQNNIKKQSAGVAIKNLFSTKQLKEYTLYLPDKEEQQIIVDEIEKQLTRLEDSIGSIKNVKEKLKNYRKSVLKKTFEKYLVDGVEIKEYCEDIKQLIPQKEEFEEFHYLDIGSINNKRQKIENPKLILSKEAPSRARQETFVGDVLYSTVRTYLRNIAIVPDIKGIIISSTGFVVLRPKKEMNNKWLFYLLNTEKLNNDISLKQVGTSYPAIRKSELLNYNISAPSLQEQQKIVEEIESKFSVIDNVEKVVNESLLKSEQLRKSILKKAFEGELVKPMEVKIKNG
jgi:type I restriction enzyme, S subunit